MSLISPEDKPPSKHSPFDEVSATKLYSSLRIKKLILRGTRFSTSKWGNEFRLLRTHYNEKQIEVVLNFYIDHLGDEYLPAAHSASSFRKKFIAIEQAMKRDGKQVIDVKITTVVEIIQRRLNYDWPSNERKDELKFLQLSYNYASEFSIKLQKLMKEERAKAEGKTNTGETAFYRLVHHLYWNISTPSEIVCWWAEKVHEWSWKWEGYRGHLLSRVLSDNTEAWNKHLASIVAGYKGDGGDWELVAEKLKEIKCDN